MEQKKDTKLDQKKDTPDNQDNHNPSGYPKNELGSLQRQLKETTEELQSYKKREALNVFKKAGGIEASFDDFYNLNQDTFKGDKKVMKSNIEEIKASKPYFFEKSSLEADTDINKPPKEINPDPKTKEKKTLTREEIYKENYYPGTNYKKS